MKAHALVKLKGLPTVSKHGRVERLCYFGSFTHGHVVWPWLLIASCVGEEIFFPVFRRPYRTAVLHLMVCAWPTARPCAWPYGSEKLVFNDLAGIVYLKSAELGMSYPDYTEWENAKYRKRDFFILFSSDNMRIYGI
ncbi:hypothetical protein GOBAR_AA24267 [Gossypium barbadense]|uniref:Uncharacterized protein n=1 Tax=Gossypium barbadense TaxID=3634 RepID=A0A2P5WZ89_GOSBA|nr:hypothetical protein GOBAR_AA24267 [Gossypium barbadense]